MRRFKSKALLLVVSTMAAVTLASCASAPPAADPNVALKIIGDRYVGQNVLEMTSRFGAPARRMEVDEFTVYSWERHSTLHFQTQPPLNVRCQLDAYVDKSGVVRNVGFSGQRGAACESFAQ